MLKLFKSKSTTKNENIIERTPTFKTVYPDKTLDLGHWMSKFHVGSQYSRFDSNIKRYYKDLQLSKNY